MFSKIMKLNIVKYFIISCLATGIDFSISYLLYKKAVLNYIIAANIGIIIGFIFQYFLSMKYVFKNNGVAASFAVYVLTFILGILLANSTIWVSFRLIKLSFTVSKGLSIIIPFFLMYFIRKKLLTT